QSIGEAWAEAIAAGPAPAAEALQPDQPAVQARAAALGLEAAAATVKGNDAAVIRAVAQGDPAAKVAAQLRSSAVTGKLTGAEITAALRGLREEAAARARSEVALKARKDALAGREPGDLEAEIEQRTQQL